MLEAFAQGAATLFHPQVLIVMFASVFISLIFGIIPAISGLTAMALFLPFVFRMSPEVALPFLITLPSVAFTGGAITAILLNIPGDPPNAATLLDGFPMNQKGEGARAIGAAIMASMAGAVGGVPMCLVMIPLLMPIVMAFKTPELFLLTVLGLSVLAALTGNTVIKGLIAGGLGLIAAMIGTQGSTGIARLTFGNTFLYDGLDVVVITMGLFGLPELFDMVIQGQETLVQAKVKGTISDVLQGCKDVWIHKGIWFRSTLIGHIIGIIPGVGSETSIWLAYGQAKQFSKHPEKFGTGIVEGVIAPESANHAKAAGALLTTMAFGIPGSTSMAILLGGFLLVGVTPGPRMMVDHLPLAFTLLLGVALANIMGGVICLFAAPYLVKIATIHVDFLLPSVMAVTYVGVFVSRNSILNIIPLIVFGVLGYFMKSYDFSRPPLIVGFVLGELFERYFFHSLKVEGPFFFVTPIGLSIIAMTIGLFCFPYLKKAFARHAEDGLKT